VHVASAGAVHVASAGAAGADPPAGAAGVASAGAAGADPPAGGLIVRAVLATAPVSPQVENEDFAAVTPSAAVLLDGAGTPAGLETGCVHGIAWYARTLGTVLLSVIGHAGRLPARRHRRGQVPARRHL
jgi:hypothetical protein